MLSLDQNSAELLRVISRPRARCGAEILATTASKIDSWESLIDGARSHGVLPMLFSRLASASECVPAEVLQRIKRDFEKNVFHCMTNAEELLNVLTVFEAAAIAAMPFKGVVLAVSAYGDITARSAGDLDLLIHYRDLQRATAILRSRGYELKTKTLEDGSPEAENYFEFHFERPSDGIVLELRWKLELTQPRYSYDLGMDWVWRGRCTAVLAGAAVPNLDPVTTLLVLCMHGSKHGWSRWMWICDVARLIESAPGLDWALAQREAKRVGLWRCLALGVLLAQRGADADVPEHVLRDFKGSRAICRMADFLNRNIFENPGAKPQGLIPYHLQILGWKDRVRAILSLSVLKPNERDRASVKLPGFLHPLYYVIRPFRVLLDRTGR